jgi:hypothetical protein
MRNDNEYTWLANLQPGDNVAVCYSGSFYGPRYEFTTIKSVSAKFLTVIGARYRKEDGREAGSHYHSCLVEPTEELRAEVADKKRRTFLVRDLKDRRWDSLTTADLETVYAIASKNDRDKEEAQ